MRHITMRSRTRGPTGGYSMYFRIGRGRGVKILKGVFKSKKRALESHQWDDAEEELRLLKRAEVSGVTPKGYRVTLIKRGHYWRVGIVMQHLGSTRLVDLKLSESRMLGIFERLQDRLYDKGLDHTDIHEWNVMVVQGKRKKFFAIDFSPEWIYERGPADGYYPEGK